MKKILAIIIIIFCSNAMAIEYLKVTNTKSLTGITEAEFNDCPNKIYRSSVGNKELSALNKKGQLTAALKGQTKDSIDSIKILDAGTCTYGEANEK